MFTSFVAHAPVVKGQTPESDAFFNGNRFCRFQSFVRFLVSYGDHHEGLRLGFRVISIEMVSEYFLYWKKVYLKARSLVGVKTEK